jgi:hypothetical protein
MSNSPIPNPPRRRRLTADELIAVVIALAGIGTVFFWGIGQKNSPLDLNASIAPVAEKSELIESETDANRVRQPIPSVPENIVPNPAPADTVGVPVITAPVATAVAPVVVPPVVVPPVIVPPVAVAPSPVAPAPEFKDIPKDFWGQGYIAELQKLRILDDFGEGKFDPTKPITRGEYAKIIDRAFPEKPATTPAIAFKDIPANYPRKDAIDRAVKIGFMSGYSPTKFSPNQVIPRYQMQISLAKGLSLPLPTDKEGDKVLSKFDDANKMPGYARAKIAAAVNSELVVKDKTVGKLSPLQSATRADAAALIYQALVKEGKIKPNLTP